MLTKTALALSAVLMLAGTSGALANVEAEAQLVTYPFETGAHAAFAQAPTVPGPNQNVISSDDWSVDADGRLVK